MMSPPVGYYINLQSRDDRRNHIETAITSLPFFSRIKRFNAFQSPSGIFGCAVSHHRVIQQILAEYPKESYVCVLEDDFWILPNTSEVFQRFTQAFTEIQSSDAWDVILLTANCPDGIKHSLRDSDPTLLQHGFRRIDSSLTVTGYIAKTQYLPRLLEVFAWSIQKMQKFLPCHFFAIDVAWKPLQDRDRFYFYQDVFAGQLPGWSNIENRQVDYTQFFTTNVFLRHDIRNDKEPRDESFVWKIEHKLRESFQNTIVGIDIQTTTSRSFFPRGKYVYVWFPEQTTGEIDEYLRTHSSNYLACVVVGQREPDDTRLLPPSVRVYSCSQEEYESLSWLKTILPNEKN